MKCYNCGIDLTNDIKTKEHIPAKAYFVGYGDDYKDNRLTVPACRSCNDQYSKIDNEIRDAIGVLNEKEKGQMELTRKATKSILRNIRGKENRLHFDESGKVEAVEFKYSDFKTLAIKDFKGIFFEKYGFPLSKNWRVNIIGDFEHEAKLVDAKLNIYAYLDKDINWSKSGHLDIFKYKIKTLTADENDNIYDSNDVEKTTSIASVQYYHNKIGFIVLAVRKKYLNKVKYGSSTTYKPKPRRKTRKKRLKERISLLKKQAGKKVLNKKKKK